MRAFQFGCMLLTTWLAYAMPAQADTVVPERLLGLSEQELANAVPNATRSQRPAVGQHGSRGLWLLADANVGSLHFEATFYFKNKIVARVEERRRTLDNNNCNAAYTALLASLTARYGVAVQSDSGLANEGQSRSAAWAADDFKVAAYRMPSASQCDLLVAFEPLAQRDASEL